MFPAQYFTVVATIFELLVDVDGCSYNKHSDKTVDWVFTYIYTTSTVESCTVVSVITELIAYNGGCLFDVHSDRTRDWVTWAARLGDETAFLYLFKKFLFNAVNKP